MAGKAPRKTASIVAFAPPVERLSADEMAYHTRVVQERNAALAIYQIKSAVGEAWWDHLSEKYRLAPDDMVDASGTIRRVPAPDEEPNEAPEETPAP